MGISHLNTGIRHIELLTADVIGCGGVMPASITSLVDAFAVISAGHTGDDPTGALVAAVAAGQLTGADLDAAIVEAAASHATAAYRQGLQQRAAPPLMRAVERELRNGAADEIIASLRPTFDGAAATLTKARELVDASASAETFLKTASAAGAKAWQSIDGAVATLNRIAYVATQFGPGGQLELIDGADPVLGVRLHPNAVVCVGEALDPITATTTFNRPGLHRHSPWFAVSYAAQLNTLAESRERVRAVAEGAFAAIEGQRVVGRGRLTDGGVIPEQARRNPYAASAPSA